MKQNSRPPNGRKKIGDSRSRGGSLSDLDISKVYADTFRRIDNSRSSRANGELGGDSLAHPDDARMMLRHIERMLRAELRDASLLPAEEREKLTPGLTLKRHCLQGLKRFNSGEVATLDQAFGIKRTAAGQPAQPIEVQEQLSAAILRNLLRGGPIESAIRAVAQMPGDGLPLLSVPALHAIWRKNKGAAFRSVKFERTSMSISWTDAEKDTLEAIFGPENAEALALVEEAT